MRIFGGIAEHLAQAVDGGADAVLEFNDGAVGPELVTNFFARHQVAGAIEQHRQDSKRLFGQAHGLFALLAELTRAKVQLEAFEADQPLSSFGFPHLAPRSCAILSLRVNNTMPAMPALKPLLHFFGKSERVVAGFSNTAGQRSQEGTKEWDRISSVDRGGRVARTCGQRRFPGRADSR